MKKQSTTGNNSLGRQPSRFSAELLESRVLFSALPTVKILASVPTASGITGADGQFEVTRTGSTSAPLKVYYHATSATTINSHQYTKLTGEVTIHSGQSVSYIDVRPVTGLTVSTNPVLVLALTNRSTYTANTHKATVTVDESGSTTVGAQRYYLPITVAADGYVRTDEPVDNTVNLTTALSSLSGSGAIEDSSLKVVETDSSGTVIDSNVPFQFDKASGYDATTNASGDLVLEMTGTTSAAQTRYYRLYFDTQGTFTAPTFAAQTSVTTSTDSVGLASYNISNSTATYVMQQSTGGISAILDKSNNDWVGFNSSGGSAGEYRGVPNLGIPSGLHPYDPTGNFPSSDAQDTATTTVVNTGPLKTTINVASTDGNVNVTYEFYSSFVRVTINKAQEQNSNGNDNYWFLYEGTPGGSFNTGDSYLLSDGYTSTLNNSFDSAGGIGVGSSTDGQWAAFESASENRFIYFANDNVTAAEDSYYDLNDQMTVFGFGRTSPSSTPSQAQELTGANSFTIGIADGNSAAADTINGQYRSVTATLGTPGKS